MTPESSVFHCQSCLTGDTHDQVFDNVVQGSRTPSLDPHIHLRLARVRDRVAAELNGWVLRDKIA